MYTYEHQGIQYISGVTKMDHFIQKIMYVSYKANKIL